MSIKPVMPSNHLLSSHHLLLLPSNFLSMGVFSNESVLRIRWQKYCSFNFNINSSNEYSWLISFRIDWLDLLAVQGTQESSPTQQFKSINSSALSFLYSPTLTSIHDYRKNHSYDWRREWQTTSVFLPWEPHEQHEKWNLSTQNIPKQNSLKMPVFAVKSNSLYLLELSLSESYRKLKMRNNLNNVEMYLLPV